MHSWRVLLMDHGGHMEGYYGEPALPAYRFDERWNSPNNQKLEETIFQAFACPSDSNSLGLERTNIVAVVGEKTLWSRKGTRDLGNYWEKYPDKILLIELPDSDIHWMEPRDITFDEAMALFSAPDGLKATRHSRDTLWWGPPEGLHYLTADRRWKSMQSIRDRQQFADLLTIEATPEASE